MKPDPAQLVRVLFVSILANLAFTTFADDLFVGPGCAYETIQAAVDAAKANDIIHVAAGVYETGGNTVYRDTPARVKIDGKKGLRIIGAGRGKTIIRGTRPEGLGNKQSDEARAASGSPYRCVHVANATDVRLQDLTLECGETRNSLAGGGVCLKNATAILVDCDIRNCAAGYAAGVSGGDKGVTLVRTRITDTFASTGDGGAVTGGTALVNCVFARTATDGSTVSGSTLYNCTLADNKAATALGSNSRAVNSLVVLSAATLDASELDGTSTGANSVFGSTAGHFQVVAPTVGDLRLLATSPAVTAGILASLNEVALPADVSAFVDVDGRPIVADGQGRIAAGAVQTTMVPMAGRLVFTNAVHVISGKIAQNASQLTWVYPEVYPTQIQVSVVPPSGYALLRWQRSDDGQYTYPSWKDGTAWVMPSPTVGEESVYTAILANNIYYVKPDGDDTANGKSTNTAWKTLGMAAKTPSGKYPAIVYVLPGTYAPETFGNTFEAGGKTYGGNSVFAVNHAQFALVAADGPEKTVIKGKACADGDQIDAENYPGCGPGALNIAVLRNASALIGFTLTGGHAVEDGAMGCVSGMSAGSYTPQVLECIISNNVSMYQALTPDCFRCRVTGNISKLDIISGVASQCEVRDNVVRTGGCGAIKGSAIFCTAVGTPLTDNLWPECKSLNSVWDGGATVSSKWTGYGANVCWNYSKNSSPSVFVSKDPFFAARAISSTLLAFSPAVGAGVAPTAENCTGFGRKWYLDLGANLEGNPICWMAGKATIGAYQDVLPGALIGGDPRGGYAYDGVTEGAVVLDDTLSFTVCPAAGTRPCVGVEVNGTLRPFTNYWSEAHGKYEIPVSAADAVDGVLTVQPAYSNDWYADDDGDDSNSGFLPKLAKKTLADTEAMLSDGDTLWVLPGTYDTGSNRLNATETVWSRLVVQGGHTVISTEGPEKTFIVGAAATIDPDDYGCGTNAIRCVTIKSNGTISGFTLTGGRVDRSFRNKPSGMGAGVIGESINGLDPAFRMRVENCIISNCNAYAGAGATRVQLVRSRVLANRVSNYGSGTYQARQYGCLFAGNIGNGVLNRCTDVIGCTVAADNLTFAGAVAAAISDVNGGALVANALFCAPITHTSDENALTLSHCAYPDDSTLTGALITITDCVETNVEALAIDGAGAPVVGSNAAIDKGDPTAFDDSTYAFLDPVHDLYGFQRVMNGVMDIGCCEGDWSRRYAKDLGSARYVTVSDVSPDVVENAEKKIDLPASATLTLTWAVPRGPSAPRILSFVVTSGTLTVARAGGETVVCEASPNVQTVVLPGDAVERLVLTTSEDGAATLLSCRRQAGMMLIFR